MIFRRSKLLISLLVLSAFISVGILGLLQMSHSSTTAPMANCPYSLNAFSVCSNDFEHINNWQQFSNVVFPSLLVLSLLIFGTILYFLDKRNILQTQEYFYTWKYRLYSQKLYECPNRVIKWLSLLENSPSR